MALIVLGTFAPACARAQTDFFNTDRGRPFRIEDAYALERYGFELQAAPLLVERGPGGRQQWSFDPKVAFGVAPRTQLDVGARFAGIDTPEGISSALAGVEISALHTLAFESRRFPAFALAGSVLLPAGGYAPSRTLGSAGLRATRSMTGGFRLHANADYTIGESSVTEAALRPAAADASRWDAGLALDRAIVRRSALIGIEAFARQPLAGTGVEWSANTGLRLQLDPRWVFDAGIGRRFTGRDATWFLTAGGTATLGVRRLMSLERSRVSQPAEQVYLPSRSNWTFRRFYGAADRLFNAFDYGHAILYESLWREPGAGASALEENEYAFVTRQLLNAPPRLPLEERAIEPQYARLVPEAKLMFDWAHVLHRQAYDILADERLSSSERDAAMADALRYYRSRPDLAFSERPKSMALMEGQPYSLAFRRTYPKFNGLIWAYHWLQVGLYEPLLTSRSVEERQAGVSAAIARFRGMMVDAPRNFPSMMPMTPAIAPAFTARYPEFAIIFDNLHSMHDVISDILANPSVPRERKRPEILRAAAAYRDDVTAVTSVADWKAMAEMMGLDEMGGPVTALLKPPAAKRPERE